VVTVVMAMVVVLLLLLLLCMAVQLVALLLLLHHPCRLRLCTGNGGVLRPVHREALPWRLVSVSAYRGRRSDLSTQRIASRTAFSCGARAAKARGTSSSAVHGSAHNLPTYHAQAWTPYRFEMREVRRYWSYQFTVAPQPMAMACAATRRRSVPRSSMRCTVAAAGDRKAAHSYSPMRMAPWARCAVPHWKS